MKGFEEGKAEILELISDERGPWHRYMAPLIVKQACLKCHADGGYKLGEIRGGISITMPAEKILDIRQSQRVRAVSLFGGGALSLALLIHFVIWRSRKHFLHLRLISDGQERLIAERTADLSTVNGRLLDEIAERKRKEVQITESEARYRSVLETSQDAIVIIQAPGFDIVYANEQTAALLGRSLNEILGQPLPGFVADQDRPMIEGRLSGEPLSSTFRVRFACVDASSQRVGDVHVAHIENAAHDPQWVVSIKDVTARLADERALQIAAAVIENASEGIVVTDTENRIMQVNPAFTTITGYPAHEVMGKDPRCLSSGRHDASFFRGMWQELGSTGRWEGEVWNRRPEGALYLVWLSIAAIRGEGAESGGRHVATFIDITQRKEIEELLCHRAQSDPLTDLPNRALFYDRLQVALVLAHRYGHQFALFYLDLDHFKEVNDTMGHAAGDQLLVETGQRLTLSVRDSDTVARLGGDEFAVILPNVGSRPEVEEIAHRIVASLARPFELSCGTARVSVSVGVAIYPEHGRDLDTIRASADAALYAVKQGGRNGYRLAEPVGAMSPPAKE